MNDRPINATVVRSRITRVTIERGDGSTVVINPTPPINVSATDVIAVERGSLVVRHGKRHRVTASVPIPPAVRVEV